jgi:hypothetical protein
MGMNGYFSVCPLWACVKVADYCDSSFVGTLTCIKTIEYVCECNFATDCM